jgi:phenylpropionate dioxygenase-like ring-hydroxylating dioxygenase large terminal subunit
MAKNFPLPIPNGWFSVCYSDELAVGEVKALHYFGQDLVAFRDAEGEAHVLDAYCPHLGAHLGVGGAVEGKSIRCPFHAWEFDGASGVCTNIPYAKRIPPKAGVEPWITREVNGFVLVWRHAEGKPPEWEIPEIAEATSENWSTPQRYEWTMQSQAQEIVENAADTAHFRYVHGTLNIPKSEVEQEGPFRHSRHPVKLDTPRGEVNGEIESRTLGLGLSVVQYRGIAETIQMMSTTPIDEDRIVHRKSFRQPKVDGQDPKGGAAAAIIKNIVKQLNQDVPIWEAKTYHSRPLLCEGDGPIAQYRKWASQFYSTGDEK